ncbi:MAG TPA: RNA polymerase sigma-54 factor, partial [Candidatus Methylacidiphilales bacterium]|nr:RNA polymerase sigma-54 factor [Candidatus Methylacidiphilales bacterium]
MQQSLQFLQAPAMELQSLVQQEIEINPVLEETPDQEKPEAAESSDTEDWDKQLEELRQKDEDWREYFSQSNTSGQGYNPEAAERRQFLFDSQVEAPHLAEHLQRQLTLSTSNADMLRVGEEIIGNIDDAGFLKVQLVEVAQSARVEYSLAQETLDLIQTFDPVGVAARDLRECLLIQIKRLGKADDIEAQVVSNYLNELGRKKYQDIARGLKVPLERVQVAAQFIATLQPRPGSSFSSDDKQNIVQAEL